MMVKKMGAWMLLALLTLVGDWCGRCYGCLEEERIGLLEIKALTNPYNDSIYMGDWVEYSSNCCEWHRIECDNTTRRVIRLSLKGARYQSLGDWVLNASLFLPFKELQSLDLSSNGLVGCSENQGFEVLSSRLKKLENLDLRGNQCNDSIFSSITGFSSLKSLDLSYNQLTGSGLKVLSSRMKKLENLDLSYNQCNDSIFSFLSGLSSLKSLDLSKNQLTGSSTGINSFQVLVSGSRKLEELDLSYNKLNDSILSCLGGFSNLKSLNLSNNSFTGSTGLNGLRKLEILNLEYTDFKESILIESLGALPSLKTLKASGSTFKHFGKGLSNSSSLEEVVLDDSSLPASFLRNIGPLSTLKILSLTGVDFNSTLPAQGTFFNLSTLEELNLDYTSLPLNFLQNIEALPALKVLSVRYCDLNGTLPAQGWCELKNLEQLFLSGNNLKGVLPPCLGNLSSLQILDLSDNQLEGNIASSHLSHLTQLEYLSVSNNYFQVPISFGNLSFLQILDLSYNQLSGPLPSDFYNLSSLVIFDLGDNNLTGPIPNWIDSLSELSIFVLKSNQFNGKLPYQLCLLRKLSMLDLSENNFSGLLPSCLSNLNFMALDEKTSIEPGTMSRDDVSQEEIFPSIGSYLYYKTVLPEIDVKIAVELTVKKIFYTHEGGILRYMSALDLSCNRFTGEIPTEWGNLSGIYALNLSQNNLTGLIPPSFSNLKQIQSLDLSHNNLNGRIPAQLVELTFLAVFDVSYNNLSGRIPEMGQFGTFDERSYKGNPLLCGPPLQNYCNKTESNGDGGFIDMDSFYAGFGVFYINVVLTIAAVLCINPHWRRRWFYFIEECIDTCYCFLVINFRKLSRFRR